MRRLTSPLLACAALIAFATSANAADAVIETPLGDIELDLYEDQTPLSVANFLDYVRSGGYADAVIHRSVPGFVIQGGAYQVVDGLIQDIPTNDPVRNEPGIPNTRGTIAMAKLAGDPDSATSSWFINLQDNPDLDAQNGGFTVFGEVVGDGMDVVDAIAALPVFNLGFPGFGETPLIDFDPAEDEQVAIENFVVTNTVEPSDFTINQGLNDAWFNPDTDGQGFLFAVFPGDDGPDDNLMFMAWFTFDTERPPEDVTAIIGEPGHRWLTAQGPYEGNVASLSAVLTSGGVFDSPVPPVDTDADYGTVTITFEGCDAAVVAYDLPGPGVSGEIPIRRVVQDNVALCEALQESAAAR